jgi:hypothetical protein
MKTIWISVSKVRTPTAAFGFAPAKGRDVWCHNLGPKDRAIERFSEWLGALDAEEGD